MNFPMHLYRKKPFYRSEYILMFVLDRCKCKVGYTKTRFFSTNVTLIGLK